MIPKRHWSLLLKQLSNKEILTVFKKKENKNNVVKEAITTPISAKKKIETVKKQRNHKHPTKQYVHPK